MQVNAYYNVFCFLLLIIKNKNIASEVAIAKTLLPMRQHQKTLLPRRQHQKLCPAQQKTRTLRFIFINKKQ